MGQKYLFGFSFEDPGEYRSNRDFGTDFETERYFTIIAHSEDDALEWGRVLARWFVDSLFGDGEEHWGPENYVNGIERNPDQRIERMSGWLHPVMEGEYPDFEEVKRAFKC